MIVQPIYFILDATHADFPSAKAEAEASQESRQPGTHLSWWYNHDNTKVAAKVIGDNEDWYKNVAWYNHPMILGVYTIDGKYGYEDVSVFYSTVNAAEWTNVLPVSTGSPV